MLHINKRLERKGQATLEFILALATTMIIFLLIAGLSVFHTVSFNKERERVLLEDVALSVQYELGLAFGVADGYKRELELPDNLDGINYSITKLGSELNFASENYNYYVAIPNITGDVLKGKNLIRKIEGEVIIEH